MDFQDFLKYVPQLAKVVLPAEEAHLKMAPIERVELLKSTILKAENPKIAAVMMLFYPKKGKTNLILIVRNEYNGVHSSQIAFPGGKYEPKDSNLEQTALRETHEEIGIPPDKIEIIRSFTSIYIPPSNFQVHPFLGFSKKELTFFPDPIEVAGLIELPLSVFLDDDIVIETRLTTSYAPDVLVPAFAIEKHIVWGATAMMLSELKDVLKSVFVIKK